MKGSYYRCNDCFDFDLCFKCYGWHETIHPSHPFSIQGKKGYVKVETVDLAAIHDDEVSQSVAASDSPFGVEDVVPFMTKTGN